MSLNPPAHESPTIRLPDYEGPAYIAPHGEPTGDSSLSTIVKWWLIHHPNHLAVMLWATWGLIGSLLVLRFGGG